MDFNFPFSLGGAGVVVMCGIGYELFKGIVCNGNLRVQIVMSYVIPVFPLMSYARINTVKF